MFSRRTTIYTTRTWSSPSIRYFRWAP